MFIRDWYREVKYFIQRGIRGYSDRDCWSVDYHLLEIIPPMVRKLKDGWGVPSSVSMKCTRDAQVKWNSTLELIALGFESKRYLKDAEYVIPLEPYEAGEHTIDEAGKKGAEKRWEEGRDLFIKYFDSLWD